MRKLLIALAALTAAAFTATLGFGSSHREAPADVAGPDRRQHRRLRVHGEGRPGALTVVANWIPFEDPGRRPELLGFDDRARYYINIDNTGDGSPDVRYRFQFKTTVQNKNSFLYALPGVDADRRSEAERRPAGTRSSARRTATRARSRRAREGRSRATCPSAPNNIGPKTIPELRRRREQAIQHARRRRQGVRRPARRSVLRRPGRDVRRASTSASGTGNQGGGKDDLRGLQHPLDRPAGAGGAGHPDGKAVSGAGRRQRRGRRVVHRPSAAAPGGRASSRQGRHAKRRAVDSTTGSRSAAWATRWSTRWSSRSARRTSSTARSPTDDAANYGKYVVKPELARVMNALFRRQRAGDQPHGHRAGAAHRASRAERRSRTNAAAGRHAQDQPRRAARRSTPNRFGVIGGDTAGFPNGRRLGRRRGGHRAARGRPAP